MWCYVCVCVKPLYVKGGVAHQGTGHRVTVPPMTWWNHVYEITNGDNPAVISRRVDRYLAAHPDPNLGRVAHQTLRRWRRVPSAIPDVRCLRAVVRTYGADMREALHRGGILVEGDLDDATAPREPMDKMLAGLWARFDHPQREAVLELLRELSRCG